jgi:hypothetical protein
MNFYPLKSVVVTSWRSLMMLSLKSTPNSPRILWRVKMWMRINRESRKRNEEGGGREGNWRRSKINYWDYRRSWIKNRKRRKRGKMNRKRGSWGRKRRRGSSRRVIKRIRRIKVLRTLKDLRGRSWARRWKVVVMQKIMLVEVSPIWIPGSTLNMLHLRNPKRDQKNYRNNSSKNITNCFNKWGGMKRTLYLKVK